jgi:hypothetical protein
MKKVLILLAVILTVNVAMAQKKDCTSAYMYNKNGQYQKAMMTIEKSVNHEAFNGMKPSDQAKAWLYRGMIYLNIYLSQDPEVKSLAPDALNIAYESLTKSIAADPEFAQENAQDVFPRIVAIEGQYFQMGIEKFNNAAYSDAATAFKKAYDISLSSQSIDTTALINAALASLKGELNEQAISYYNDLQQLGYNKVDLYKNKASIYNAMGQSDSALVAIAEGQALYPSDASLTIEKVNIYLKQGKGIEAVNDLLKLNELDPNNASILFILGTIYGDENSNVFDSEKAIEYYNRAIEINNEYYDAIYNLGALYITLSNKLKTEANDLPLEKVAEYDALIGQAEELISIGLPFVKKAYDMQPSPEVKAVLKSMYVQLKMNEEAKALDAE